MSCYKVLQQSPSRSALQAESSSVCTQCERCWNRGPCSPLCPDRSASLPHKSVSPRGRKACLLSYLSSPTPTRRVTCRFKRRHICSCHVGAWPTPSADHSSLPSLLFLPTSSFCVPVSSSISLGLTDWLSVFFFLIYISVQDKMITLFLLFFVSLWGHWVRQWQMQQYEEKQKRGIRCQDRVQKSVWYDGSTTEIQQQCH